MFSVVTYINILTVSLLIRDYEEGKGGSYYQDQVPNYLVPWVGGFER